MSNVRGGDSYLPDLKGSNYTEKFQIKLPKEYVQKHYYVWKTTSGPVIMVVCNSNNKAWWVNLKDDSVYGEEHGTIYGDPKNLFNKAAYAKINELVRHQKYIKGRAKINIKGGLLRGCLAKKSIKELGHNYYQKLGKQKLESLNPDLNTKIEFTRVGWRHILRKSRRKSRILQSLLLLPLIPDIIKQSADYTILTVNISKGEKGEDVVFEKLGIQAACEFNYRFPSIIQIILLRKKVFTEGKFEERVWFYSIYEMSRNNKLSELIVE